MTGLKLTSDLNAIRLVGVAVALVTAALLAWAGPINTSQRVFDQWQRSAPRDLSGTDVRIVWIDDKAVAEHGRWPWPRRLTSLLVSKIAAAQPRVIGLDMVFAEPDLLGPKAFADYNPELPPSVSSQINALPDYDQELANAIGQAPVIVGRVGVDAMRPVNAPLVQLLPRFQRPLPASVRSWGEVVTNLDAIDGTALGYGLLNGDPDADGVVRRVPLVARVAGSNATGLALEMAMAAKEAEKASFKGTAVAFADRNITTAADGTMALRLGDIPVSAQQSAYDVFASNAAPANLRDKIVIIAVSAAGSSDQIATSLSPSGYGATVQANAVDTILRGGELNRPGWARLVETVAAFVLTGLALWLVPILRGRLALPLTIMLFATLFAVSWIGYRWADVLIDPLSPAITALAAGLAMVILLLSRSRRLLAAEKLASARALGELTAASTIQQGMLPSDAALAAVDQRVEVAGLVEPARAIGGDFFDVVRTGPDQLCLLVGDVSGKGVPAALFMALSKALTTSALLRDGSSLAQTIIDINEDVSRDNREDMFVTLLAALLDMETGTLTLCAAGHEYPWIVRASGAVEMIKPDGGPPLGVAPGFAYGESKAVLMPGDTLVILSDGITEARTPTGQFFDHDRVFSTLAAWTPNTGVKTLTSSLRDAVRAFEAGYDATDDLTVLAVRYRPI